MLVLGMHRSGTSAIAGGLVELGVGQVHGAAVETNIENPRGFFESLEITERNDAILKVLSSRWDCPPPLPANGWSADDRFEGFARDIRLGLHSTKTDELVIKDPRISVLLPIWRRALLDRTNVVFIHRDPAEVAWSLYLRNGFDPMLGFALWSAYNAAALRDLDGLSVHVCSYEQLGADPSSTFTEVARSLEEWGENVDSAKIPAAAASIDTNLGRATWPNARAAEFQAPPEVDDLHKHLTSMEGSHRSFGDCRVDVPRWVSALLDERRRAIELERHIESLQHAPRPRRLAEIARGLRRV